MNKTMDIWYNFLDKVKREWDKLTNESYFENEDLKKSCKELSEDIGKRTISNRIELLKCINNKVIEQSKIEMTHHLEQHNLYKQLIEDYER